MEPVRISIQVSGEDAVSGLWQTPAKPDACLVLAHGAGAGMEHRSMSAIAAGLGRRGIATLRYNFPYMERRTHRPDPPPIAHAAVRAAVSHAVQLAPKLPLFAGGKSFGGRMTSQANARTPLERVRGLVFFAFPLHPAGKPSVTRAEHLFEADAPMLFLQGARDSLAELELLEPVVEKLGARASLAKFQDADHSFHVPARSGRNDAEVLDAVLDTTRDWILQRSR